MLRCADDTLYTGWTTDPEKRIKTHNAGHGAKYTKSRLPVTMVYCEVCADKREALHREAEIKKLSRKQKLMLIESKENILKAVK